MLTSFSRLCSIKAALNSTYRCFSTGPAPPPSEVRVFPALKVEITALTAICRAQQSTLLTRAQDTPIPQALAVTYADGTKFSFPAELLRAESPAANSRRANKVLTLPICIHAQLLLPGQPSSMLKAALSK